MLRLRKQSLVYLVNVAHATSATRNAIEASGIAILSYVPKFSEKLKSILLSRGIRTTFKPFQKLGGLPSSSKNALKPGYRHGAIYKINCTATSVVLAKQNGGLKRAKGNT